MAAITWQKTYKTLHFLHTKKGLTIYSMEVSSNATVGCNFWLYFRLPAWKFSLKGYRYFYFKQMAHHTLVVKVISTDTCTTFYHWCNNIRCCLYRVTYMVTCDLITETDPFSPPASAGQTFSLTPKHSLSTPMLHPFTITTPLLTMYVSNSLQFHCTVWYTHPFILYDVLFDSY